MDCIVEATHLPWVCLFTNIQHRKLQEKSGRAKPTAGVNYRGKRLGWNEVAEKIIKELHRGHIYMSHIRYSIAHSFVDCVNSR